MNTEQLSMLEVAIELMKEKKEPTAVIDLIHDVLAAKGIIDPEGRYATQLYIDITTSSDFVFCGEGKWDLKSHQSLDLYDRDGSYFNTGEEFDEDENEVNLDDYNIDEDDNSDYDDEDEDEEDEDNYEEDDELPMTDNDENDDDDQQDYLDEQEYNDIMDDYEDMYEDN